MGPVEARANIAGHVDAAGTVVRDVVFALKTMDEAKKLLVPEAMYVVLEEAEERLMRVAGWLLDPVNASLD